MFATSTVAATILPVPAESLMLDASGLPVAMGAYSLDRLDKDYTGNCIKVVRQSDNAALDIGFTSNHVDEAAIIAHCGASAGYVSVWYDQSGNGRNLLQGTLANMFRIYSGTAIDKIETSPGNFVAALYAPSQTRGMVTAAFTRYQGSKATAITVASLAEGSTTNSPRYVSLLPTTTTLGDVDQVGALMIGRNTTLEQWATNRSNGWRVTYPGTFGELQQVAAVINGTTHTMAVDSQGVSGTYDTAVNLDITRIAVGHTGYQTQSVTGSYRTEVLVFSEALTIPQKDTIGRNQRLRYGLSIGPAPTPPEDPVEPGTPSTLNWAELGYESLFFDDFKVGNTYTYNIDNVYTNTVNQTQWAIYGDPTGTVKGNEGRGWRKTSQVKVAPSGVGVCQIIGMGDFSSGLFKKNVNSTHQKYGGWEVRFKCPKGYGYGLALLLWPQSNNWPTDGEDDMVEIPKGTKDNKLHTTLHIGKNNDQSPKSMIGDWTQWHTISHIWTSTELIYWMDGVEYFREKRLYFQAPGPMWLGMQYDVGGYNAQGQAGWIAVRDATTPQPSIMEIDYVRILRKTP